MSFQKKRQAGFTLIEVIVAVSIFSFLAFGCYRVVNGISTSSERINEKMESLRKMTRLIRIMDQDFRQIVDRKIINENEEIAGSVISYQDSPKEGLIVEFTRAGYRNPLLEKRAEVVRVGYSFEETLDDRADEEEINKNAENQNNEEKKDRGGYFVRYIWPTLDRSGDQKPDKQVLWEGLESVSLEFMNDDGEWIEEWPPETADEEVSEAIPYAIRIKMVSHEDEYIEKVYAIKELPPDIEK